MVSFDEDASSIAPSASASNFDATTVAPSASVSQIDSEQQPSLAYVKQAGRSPTRLVEGEPREKLLVTDLNNCLLARRSRRAEDGRRPLPRPYLSTFLAYIAKSEWSLMVWSSSKPHNVEAMSRAIGLLPDGTSLEALPKHLVAMWTRADLGLSEDDYSRKVPTIKDLDKVWDRIELGKWSQANTVLLDDSSDKASIQPHNHVALPLFDPFDNATSVNIPIERAESSFVGRSPPVTPSRSDEVDNWRRTSEWVTKTKKPPSSRIGDRRPSGERKDEEAYKSFTSPRRSPNQNLPFQPSSSFSNSSRSPPPQRSSPRSPIGRSPAGLSPTWAPFRPSGAVAAASPPGSPLQALRTIPRSFVPPSESSVAPATSTAVSTSTTARTESEADWQRDDALLRIIAALDALLPYADASSAIRSGVIARCFDASPRGQTIEDRLKALWLDDDGSMTETSTATITEADEEWVRKGKEVCARLGIEVRREFDPSWFSRV